MYRSIMVPLDGSPFGEQALPLALSLARRAGASLEVVRVHEVPAPLFSQPIPGMENVLDAGARKHEGLYVDETVKRLTSQAKVSVTGSVVDGVVVEALLNYATAKGIDLVVMTTHGRGPVGRFWLGSVADEMIRRLRVPVLLVRPQEDKPDFSKETVLRRVLIPLDGTALSEKILDHAIPLVRLMQAELILLRVIQPKVLGQPSLGEWAPATMNRTLLEKLETLDKEKRDEAGSHLDKIAAGLRSASLSVRTYLVTHDQSAAAILNEARTQGVDLIALETHGRGGFARFFLGSVADKVIRGATIPVLVHRPPPESP